MISMAASALTAVQIAATLSRLDQGAGTVQIRVYATTPPASPGSHTDTPMATVVLPKPCGTITDGALTLTAGDAALVLLGGFPRWAELVAGDGSVLHLGDVTDADGDGFYKAAGADTPSGETSPYYLAGGLLSLGAVVLT